MPLGLDLPHRAAAPGLAHGVRARRCGAILLLTILALVPPARAQDGTSEWAYLTSTGNEVVSSPALGPDGTVYVGSDDGTLYAILPSGLPRWQVNPNPLVGDYIESTPVVGANGTVYVGSVDQNLYAFNAATGDVLWHYHTGAPIYYSSPAIAPDGTIYVGSEDDSVYAFSPNGSLKWSFPTGNFVDSSPAVGADGTVYIGSDDGNFYALTPGGTQKWIFPTGQPVFSSAAIGPDGTIYLGGRDLLYALTPGGNLKWAASVSGAIEGSPVIASNGTIYVGTMSGTLYAINSSDGSQKWSYSYAALNGGFIYSTPAVRSDGTVIYGTGNGYVVSLTPDGSLLWPLQAGDSNDPVLSSPVIAPNGTIYVGSNDNRLHAIYGNGSGPDSGSWPMFHQNTFRTGLATGPTPTSDPGRLINLSVLATVGPGNQTLTLGFVTGGLGTSGSQNLLIRADGPSLYQFGIDNYLLDPALTVLSGSSVVASNDNWGVTPANAAAVMAADSAVYAFGLSSGSLDAATVATLPSNPGYTVQIMGSGNPTGDVLGEIYDDTPTGGYTLSSPRLINLSSRMNIAAGGSMTAGFIIGGSTPETVLVRAAGPALAGLGVSGVMPDPQISLYNAQGGNFVSDAGWNAIPQDVPAIAYDSNSVGAFPFATASQDSAILITLAPGAYTAVLSSKTGNSGTALIEVYEIP